MIRGPVRQASAKRTLRKNLNNPISCSRWRRTASPHALEIQIWPIDRLIFYARNPRKNDAAVDRMNDTAIAALTAHAAWYIRRFGECKPEWFVFAFGSPLPTDPTRPITSFKTAWVKVREKAGVKGRWHDNRHTLVTELAESGAGDEVIMSIAGHVSRAMLSRYSHVRMEAKRRALDEIAARQRSADERRKAETERQQAAASASQSALVQ